MSLIEQLTAYITFAFDNESKMLDDLQIADSFDYEVVNIHMAASTVRIKIHAWSQDVTIDVFVDTPLFVEWVDEAKANMPKGGYPTAKKRPSGKFCVERVREDGGWWKDAE